MARSKDFLAKQCSVGQKKKITLPLIALILFGIFANPAQALVLYVDLETNQVYTTPGKNRVKLGKFKQVEEDETTHAAEELKALDVKLDKKIEELKAIEARIEEQQNEIKVAGQQDKATEKKEPTKKDEKKWYDSYKISGYTQFRHNAGLSGDFKDLSSPGDKGIEDDTNFNIRRARLVFSGDITDHLKIYMQTEFASGDVKVRDMYGDIFFDKKREFRIRPGMSKVPNSFELLQSSRDRLAFERADPLSSGIRNERDTGVFFYWTPEKIQKRFSFLRSNNLKGSGDYGVIGFGVYDGQGINKIDLNGNVHFAARVTYPFEFWNGQIFETGVFGYTGRFVPTVGTNNGAGILTAPTFNSKGHRDERIGFHAVLYPQPFGFQTEWNWGRSPQLSADRTRIVSGDINGGYVQAMYKIDNAWGTWLPYVKWQTYDGAEKFTTNSPFSKVRETEVGLEWKIRPEIEFTAAYSNMDRTNVKTLKQVKNANIMRFQLQWIY